MRLCFAEFTLDVDRRLLHDGAVEVPLAPRTFDLLALLVQARPAALSKQDICGRIWPESFVTDNALASLVADIRAAVRDSARQPRFIRTVHGHGYAFVGQVAEGLSPAAPSGALSQWTLVWRHRAIALPEGESTLGRSGPGVVAIDAPTVSRRHARLVASGQTLTVEDLGSKNGTWLDDRPVTTAVAVLAASARLRVGRVLLELRLGSEAASTSSEILRNS